MAKKKFKYANNIIDDFTMLSRVSLVACKARAINPSSEAGRHICRLIVKEYANGMQYEGDLLNLYVTNPKVKIILWNGSDGRDFP